MAEPALDSKQIMESSFGVKHDRAHPSVQGQALNRESPVAGTKAHGGAHKQKHTETEEEAACNGIEVPASPPAAAAAEGSQASLSAKKLAAPKTSPAAAAADCSQHKLEPTAAAAPSIQGDAPSATRSAAVAEAEATAAIAAAAAVLAKTAAVSGRSTAGVLQGKVSKARLQRAKARLARSEAVKEHDVDMFRESCVIC